MEDSNILYREFLNRLYNMSAVMVTDDTFEGERTLLPRLGLTISDCNDIIELEFSIDTYRGERGVEETAEEAMVKLERLQTALDIVKGNIIDYKARALEVVKQRDADGRDAVDDYLDDCAARDERS